MVITRSYSKDLPKLHPGDLVTFIEGDSWVFIDKEGIEMRTPPVGIVISQFDDIGIKVFWGSRIMKYNIEFWKVECQVL